MCGISEAVSKKPLRREIGEIASWGKGIYCGVKIKFDPGRDSSEMAPVAFRKNGARDVCARPHLPVAPTSPNDAKARTLSLSNNNPESSGESCCDTKRIVGTPKQRIKLNQKTVHFSPDYLVRSCLLKEFSHYNGNPSNKSHIEAKCHSLQEIFPLRNKHITKKSSHPRYLSHPLPYKKVVIR